ncbi:hypothetical protein ACWCXC_15630 [Streptomyces sp. NPDC001515]
MIYHVTRTDTPGPGEFVSAVVIARGRSLAREAVSHLSGVISNGTQRNVWARPLDTVNESGIVVAYHDETPTLDDAMDIDPATDYDSQLVEPEAV